MASFLSKLVLVLTFLSLLMLPRLVEGKLYFACCDDTRLYYIFPLKYVENYAKNLVIDNTWAGANTGYYPGTQMVPMLFLLATLKALIPLNTQYLMYGANLSLAFLFTYLFLGLWIKNNTWVRMISSLFYVFSPFLIRTTYHNQLMGIHLVWVLPATLFLFIKSVTDKKLAYTLTAVLIFSVFSTGINTLPFFVPILVTSLPIFLWLFLKHPKTTFFYGILFGIGYLFLNIHWIFHFLNSIFGSTGLGGIVGNFSSDKFINENIRGIMGASTLFSPLNQPLLELDLNLRNAITPSRILSLVFILVIALAGTTISRKETAKYRVIYLIFISCWLLSWFLISPNFDKWGPHLFLLFATKIPGFTMFRNMFDKFAQPLAFYYALALGVSLSILFTVYKNRFIQFATLTVIMAMILINGKSRFMPYNVHEGIQAKISGTFNDDFNSLVDYLQHEPNASRVLWLPLNYPTYVSVEDKYNPGHFYSGLSPLRYLANRQDYSGQFSFIIPGDIYLGERVAKLITEKKYDEVGQIIQLHNARFVIVDKQVFPERMQLFLYGMTKSYLSMQTDEFIHSLLGRKLADFGNRYSMYEINPKFFSDRIYLTDNVDIIPTKIIGSSYTKIDGNTFQVELFNLNTKEHLVFLDPYYKEWTLYLQSPEKKVPFKEGKNIVVKNYANGWEIDPKYITSNFSDQFYTNNLDGSLNLKFILHFKPADYDKYLYPLNISAYLLIGLVQVGLFIKSKKDYAK